MHLSVSAVQSNFLRFSRLLGASLVGFIVFAHSAFAAAPVISGSPATWVYVGSTYSFTPTASDADRQKAAVVPLTDVFDLAPQKRQHFARRDSAQGSEQFAERVFEWKIADESDQKQQGRK